MAMGTAQDGERARLMESFARKEEDDGDDMVEDTADAVELQTRAHDAAAYADIRAGGAHDLTLLSKSGGMEWKNAARTATFSCLHLLWRLLARIRQLPATVRELGFRRTMRLVFDYPDPDLPLRSTAWLDGLRGLAALEVFIFHYADGWIDCRIASGPDGASFTSSAWYYAPVIRTFFASGNSAVCIFFAISGYVLSYRILAIMRQRNFDELLASLSSAVFRRGIRLYTPVVVETFLLMLAARLLGLPKASVYPSAPSLLLELREWFVSLLHLLLPLRYPDRWDALVNRYDGGISWTIPLEYHGSLYLYLSLVFLARVHSLFLRRILILAMALQCFAKDDWIAAQFMLGMAYADSQLEPERPILFRRFSLLRSAFPWLLFFFGFYLSGLPPAQPFAEFSGDTRFQPRLYFEWIVQPTIALGLYDRRQADRYLQNLATICLLIGIGETPLLRTALRARFVQYLGRISFGLYLCHIWVRAYMAPVFGSRDALYLVGLDPDVVVASLPAAENPRLFLAYLINIFPAACVTFFVAGLFERFLDRPSVRLGRAFERFCLSFAAKDAGGILNGEAGTAIPSIHASDALGRSQERME